MLRTSWLVVVLTATAALGMAPGIQQSVGDKGVNRANDVKLVQGMLNKVPARQGGPETPLAVDGKVGPATVAAIRRFQKVQLKLGRPDGRVDPDGPTLARLQSFPGGQGGGLKPGGTAAVAAKIRDSKRIELLDIHPSGRKDEATAKQNIADTAGGKKARRSSYGTAPGGSVALQPRLLKGMLELSETFPYRVTEIAGGEHSKTSRHYAGVAFDVDEIDGKRVNASNRLVKAFMKKCRDLGADEVLGPGDPGHSTHVHAAWKRP